MHQTSGSYSFDRFAIATRTQQCNRRPGTHHFCKFVAEVGPFRVASTLMRRWLASSLSPSAFVFFFCLLPFTFYLLPLLAQQIDPVAGSWRGTVKNAQGVETPIILTIAKRGDVYSGTTNGLHGASEIPLKRIAVDGARVSIEAGAESRLGDVSLTGELTADGRAMAGTGVLAVGSQRFDVTFALQRRPRPEVIQPQVAQRIDYFVGTWAFEYTGAEYPPLSAGSRSGTVTFTREGTSNFVMGRLDGDVGGRKFQETLRIGLDAATSSMVYREVRGDGTELLSVVNWRSPIAMTFQTSPLQSNGKTYQLRRVINVTSPAAFELVEEFSVDGGPFRRLGNAH